MRARSARSATCSAPMGSSRSPPPSSTCPSRTRSAPPSSTMPTSRRAPPPTFPACPRSPTTAACASRRSATGPASSRRAGRSPIRACRPRPGPARSTGERDFNRAMRRVQDELEALGPDASRNAHFVCALALCWPDGHSEWFEGRVDGTLTLPPRGDERLRLRPDLRPRRPRADLRRDGPGREARDEPPRRRLPQAGGGASVNHPVVPAKRESSRRRAGFAYAGMTMAWPSTSTGRSASPNAPIATSTAMSASRSTRTQWRDALLADLAHEARADARPPADLDLLRRRHALADAAGDRRRPDRGGGARIGASRPTSRSRWRPTPPRSRRRASPTSPRAGVNRVSLGLQSLDDAALRFLGRAHDVDEGLTALGTAQSAFAPGQLRPDLRPARPERRRLGGRARPRALLRHRPSLALPAHHRARHALRRAGGARASSSPPIRTRARRSTS